MPRSAGVTTSAVVVLAGALFTILCGVMMLLGSAFISKSNLAADFPAGPTLASILIIEAIIVLAFGGWGLGTAVGLLYLKGWARISLLIFAGLLVFVSLPGAVLIAFIPFPSATDPNLPPNFASITRFGMGLFYVVLAALAGFWLYFFNKRSVKAQFQTNQLLPESAAGDLFLGTPVSVPAADQHARPLSITVIGWFLLISSALAPLFLLINRALFHGMQFPLYFLGVFFFGRSAHLIFILWMAAQLVAAAGLLKLKRWAFFGTIGLQCLALVNGMLLVSIPGHRARFQQIMETMMASMNAQMPQPVPFNFSVWLGFAMSLPFVALILWFLATNRRAFTSA